MMPPLRVGDTLVVLNDDWWGTSKTLISQQVRDEELLFVWRTHGGTHDGEVGILRREKDIQTAIRSGELRHVPGYPACLRVPGGL